MRHQCTDLLAHKHKNRKPFVKHRPPSDKNDISDRHSHYKKGFDSMNVYRNKERCQKCGDSKHIEGFQCPAKKFQCKSYHKYGHFISFCYLQGEGRKIATSSHLITNLAYKRKPHQTRNQYLRARLDTCADVNIMPASVYKLVFNDPELKKFAANNLEIGTYTTNTVKIVGSCLFYLVHPDTKKLQEVVFYVARNDDSVFMSCTTTLALGLIQPHTRLDYLPPRTSLITSSFDHPRKTKKVLVHRSKKEVSAQSSNQTDVKQLIPKLVTSKEPILQSYPDVFEGIGCFPGSLYHIHIDQSVTPKQTPYRPILVHLKEAFQQEIDKILKVGVLKQVHKATPWVNNFVLVGGRTSLEI